MRKERTEGYSKWLIAVAGAIGVVLLYALTAGFVLAPVEKHLSSGSLTVSEVVYAPMIALYRASPTYKAVIDWEDDMARKW